jgi:CheY-like chemotaxis protein
VRARVSEFCVQAFGWATTGGADLPSYQRGRRFGFECGGASYEGNATPVVDPNKKITRMAAVVGDATRAKSLQARIDAIDKAGEELVSLDAEQIARLDVQERLELLEQKIIRYTNELMQVDNFTVFLLDKKMNKLELILSWGMPTAIREIPLYAREQGNGISGYVAARGRSYICPDVENDDRYLTGIEGAKSSLTVPLELHDEVIGVLNVESRKPAAFTEDDRQFAEIFARHIAVAIHILNLLVSERHTTTGQLASNVMAEITGPLNDIVTEVGSLVEDYIGHDELRHRLNQISDNSVRIRDAIRQVTSPQPGLIDRRPVTGTVRYDPVLSGRKVLVADDEEVIRDTVCDVLRSYGCETESAKNGEEAVQLVGQHDFDLVLCDIKMPDRSGYEVFASAKDRNSECPVILMTGFGYDPNHSIVRARREGLAAVLFKPFKVEQLLGEIRTAIRSAAPK